MFDISWSHLSLFALAAIVLIPSKDLPGVLRTLGRYVGDARRMATDFRRQVDDALRETEIASIKDSVTKEMTDIQRASSLVEEGRALNSAFSAAAVTAGSQPAASATQAGAPTGQIVPNVGASLPVVETKGDADAAAFGSGATVPMPPLAVPEGVAAARPLNGANGKAAEPRGNDGIEIVRAGRGSVAQRAAAAWKKTAGSSDNGS